MWPGILVKKVDGGRGEQCIYRVGWLLRRSTLFSSGTTSVVRKSGVRVWVVMITSDYSFEMSSVDHDS